VLVAMMHRLEAWQGNGATADLAGKFSDHWF
jgi:hypothetical protein